MKKLLNLLRWIDDNLLHLAVIAFIFAAPLVPKIPVTYVEYTYIRIRYDDFIILALYAIFALQLIRKKIKFNTKFLVPIVVFWGAVFVSFLIGHYIHKTVPVFNIGFLHSLRRIEYMTVFFVASSLIISEKRFMNYLKLYIAVLLIASFYGIGQKLLNFPSIQSINPAYADGRILFLNPEDRINSTFGGHFDFAAYLIFSIPILLAMFVSKLKKRFIYILIFIVSLTALLYTSARSSFLAYAGSVTLLLGYFRRFLLYFFVVIITTALLILTGDTTKRFLQTFQFKIVFVNLKTGEEKIEQTITTKELPAGSYKIPLAKQKKVTVSQEELERIALEQALKEAQRKSLNPNLLEVQKRAAEFAKFIRPQKTILCDIACATRLQVEWPRAIAAFSYNPVFGTGPSSITEATDNDFLRWLGETGLIGTLAFLFVLFSISKFVWKATKKGETLNYIHKSFVFGVIALLANAVYVDIFEASKVAYNFWLIAGIYVGFITQNAKKPSK